MNDVATRPSDPRTDRRWRGPTILEIARVSGVGTATVDRVLNGRGGVRVATRSKVLAAVDALNGGAKPGPVAAPSAPGRVPRRLGPRLQPHPAGSRGAYGRRADVACTFAAVASAGAETRSRSPSWSSGPRRRRTGWSWSRART